MDHAPVIHAPWKYAPNPRVPDMFVDTSKSVAISHSFFLEHEKASIPSWKEVLPSLNISSGTSPSLYW